MAALGFLHEGGVCWNVEFGHAADALPPNTLQTERTDGRPSGRARGVGFALRPWESLWLTSPAQGADVTGLNSNERSEKRKLTWTTVHKALCKCKHFLVSCLREENGTNAHLLKDLLFEFRFFFKQQTYLVKYIFLV